MRCPPRVLTRVCGRWRELALSLPVLWSSFGVTSRILSSPWLKIWINRSSNHPLDLFVEIESESGIAFLLEHIHRCSSLVLDISRNLKGLSGIPFEDAPLLRRFVILAERCNSVLYGDITRRVNLAPVLQELDLSIDLTPKILHLLTWPQLSHVTLDASIPLDECIAFLASCPQMAYFDAGVGGAEIAPAANTTPIVLLRMASLTIVLERDASNFLDFFTLPYLQTLDLHAEDPGDQAAESLICFISRSRCKLTALDFNLREACLTRCINSPYLTSLLDQVVDMM